METAYLALGSNVGSKVDSLRYAVAMLDADESCRVTARSSFYLTKPVGVQDQPDFMNAVIQLETTLKPRELLRLCKEIEQRVGRKRTFRWGPRVIDIDVLLYNDVHVEEDDFIVPHPRMMERAFVLVPLAQISPDLVLSSDTTAAEAARQLGQEGVEIMEGVSWEN